MPGSGDSCDLESNISFFPISIRFVAFDKVSGEALGDSFGNYLCQQHWGRAKAKFGNS